MEGLVLGIGVALIAFCAGLTIWYNTAVMNDAEIARLEAGAAAEATAFEGLAVFLIPASGLAGITAVAIVVARWAGRRTAR